MPYGKGLHGMNWAILLLLVLLAWHGYGQGFVRGLRSILAPLLGVWLALRRCDDLAPLLARVLPDATISRFVAFFLIIACVWLGLTLLHRLLFKLVDTARCAELDRFLGACLGLAHATVLVWVLLVAALGVFPPFVRTIERSSASMRILALGELVTGPVHARGPALSAREPEGLAMSAIKEGDDTRFLKSSTARGP